jgi:hypothetical protein
MDLIAQVAFLDPVTNPSGLEQRLTALGLLPALPSISDPDVASVVADEYRMAALQVFQQQQGIEQTGELDVPTKKALQDAHGA